MPEILWACEQSFLERYCNKVLFATSADLKAANELRGEGLVMSADEAKKSVEENSILTIAGDTAIIKIEGVLSKEGPDWIDVYFGYKGTSYNAIIEAIESVQSNSDVKLIVLRMDTPGGYVNGVDETWQAVKASEIKVIAENHGMIASGGYWIASAADEIVAIAPTVETGSIGVLVAQWDYTKALADLGIEELHIVSSNAPKKDADLTTKKGIDTIQRRIDATESVFIDRVATGRKVSVEKVIEDFGQGGVLIAQNPNSEKTDALKVGMIDSVVGQKTRQEKGEGIDSDLEVAMPEKSDREKEEKKNVRSISGAITRGDSQMSELQKLIADNMALRLEVDALKAEAFEMGAKSVTKRIETVAPFLAAGNSYPAPVKALANKALLGEVSTDTLIGAVVAYDALKEQSNTEASQLETEEKGETPSQGGGKENKSTDGVIRTTEDLDIAVAMARGEVN